MKKMLATLALVAALTAVTPRAANAGVDFSFFFGLPGVAFVPPPPPPPPVYYAPAPVVVAPAPIYYARPGYYGYGYPAPYVRVKGHHWGHWDHGRHRGWYK